MWTFLNRKHIKQMQQIEVDKSVKAAGSLTAISIKHAQELVNWCYPVSTVEMYHWLTKVIWLWEHYNTVKNNLSVKAKQVDLYLVIRWRVEQNCTRISVLFNPKLADSWVLSAQLPHGSVHPKVFKVPFQPIHLQCHMTSRDKWTTDTRFFFFTAWHCKTQQVLNV